MTTDIRLGTFQSALDDVKADLIFTSPPYNIGSKQDRSDGNRGQGLYDVRSYAGITGYDDDLPEDEYRDSQIEFLLWAADHLADNGTLVYNHKPRRRNGSMIHPVQWLLDPKVTNHLTLMEEVIWDRGSTHNHARQLMWPHTERLYVLRLTDHAYSLDNTADLPQRSDVWRINKAKNIGHCAPFPVELAEAGLLAWSKPGDLVCDPYTGSGTTAIAAMNTGRRFVGSEMLPNYHKMACNRVLAHYQESTEWMSRQSASAATQS